MKLYLAAIGLVGVLGAWLVPGPAVAAEETTATGTSAAATAIEPDRESKEARLARSVDELRAAIGKWNVVTEFLDDDGSVARTLNGTYEFSWVTPDRVAIGQSHVPEMNQSGGILFYVNEKKEKIEMVAVHPDGMLWIMSGPLGGSTRYSQEFDTADGGKSQLRFTRFNVKPDRFDSKMEYTTDGGRSWIQGNRQVFQRASAE